MTLNTITVFSLYGPLAASHRVRFSQFSDLLLSLGIRYRILSLLSDRYLQNLFSYKRTNPVYLFYAYLARLLQLLSLQRQSLCIVYCELFPFLPLWIERFLLPRKYIYDLDDAFFLKYSRITPSFLQHLYSKKIDYLITHASAVTAGNYYLADYCHQLNDDVHIIPSVVDTNRYIPAPYRACNDIPIVGWIGTPSTSHFLELVVPALQELSRTVQFLFHIIGSEYPKITGVNVTYSRWSRSTEIEMIQSFDIGIMPLSDTSWSRGKCSYKLIQCMSCGVPVVASAVGSNLDVVVENGGYLASSTDEWIIFLRELLTHPTLRESMGIKARKHIVENYSATYVLPLLHNVLSKSLKPISP